MTVRVRRRFQRWPGRLLLLLAILAGSALMVASAAGPAQASQIESISIVSESANSVTFEIIYDYDGGHGDNVFMSVIMAQNGETSSHYGYRPGTVRSGRHRTRVELNALDRAPELFSTNQIEVAMYAGGNTPFLNRTYAFPKTWSRPRAGLTAVGTIVGQVLLSPNLAVRPVLANQAASNQLAGPSGGSSGGDEVVGRRVLSDGSIELRYGDGTVRIRTGSGETVINPDGTRQVYQFQNAQPPTPPSAPPDAAHAAWVDGELASQLNVIQQLVGFDQQSIDHYLAQEGAGLSPYQRITQRTRAIDMLVRP